jgi:putative membrane protein
MIQIAFSHFLPRPKTVLLSRTACHTLLSERKTLLAWLGTICGVVWIAAAIHPLDQQAWILENILLVVFVAALALTYRQLQFSKASYLLLAAFVLLHIIGAHYT